MASIIKRIGEGVAKMFRRDTVLHTEAEKVRAISRDLEQESRLNKIVLQVEALKVARQTRLRGDR